MAIFPLPELLVFLNTNHNGVFTPWRPRTSRLMVMLGFPRSWICKPKLKAAAGEGGARHSVRAIVVKVCD
jgi:hypothetical protein